MKTTNSIKNSFLSVICNIVVIFVNFVGQSFFIHFLGNEYLGLNGLFTNIISMLSIIDLGIGAAIIYNLYKPISENDFKTVNALMNFYKKAYYIIAFLVAIIGLCIIPFLSFFIHDITINININLVYILFIVDTVASYLLSYKRSLLYADQKNYIINIIHIFALLLLNTIQIISLYLTKNYYVYLIIKVIIHIFENLIISYVVNLRYSYIRNNSEKLDKDIEKDIFKKVRALLFHKIGSFIISGTDNLIISRYLGLVVVGLYSNYYMIINAVSILFGQIITSLTSSIGHLLVENNREKNFSVFKKTRFINFWIASFSGIAILVIMTPFIKLWLGSNYLLGNIALFVLVFNFYQKMMRNSYSTFKEAAGIFYEDRFVPLFESLINIVASIILVKFIGLPGVFLGTIISGFALWCYSYPKYVYKKLFNGLYVNYVKETLGYILLFIVLACLTYFISSFIMVENNLLQVIINAIVCLIIPNVLIIIIFRKTENYIYFKDLFQRIVKRK